MFDFNEDVPVFKATAKVSAKTQLKQFNKKLQKKAAAAEIMESIDYQIAEGEAINVFTAGQSNAGGFYEVMRDKYEYIDELVMATWIISRDYAIMLENDLKRGALGGLTMIISNRMSQLPNKKATYNYIVTNYPKLNNTNFAVVNSHAKTYGMKIRDQYININGSGNWSENPRIENYTISGDKESYNFRKNYFTELIHGKGNRA